MNIATFLKACALAVFLVICAPLRAQGSPASVKPVLAAHSVNLTWAMDELDRDFGDEDAAGDKWSAAPSIFGTTQNVRTTEHGYEFILAGKRTDAISKLKEILTTEAWTLVGESLAARTYTLDLARNGELLSADITENADLRTSRVSALHFIAKISRKKASPVQKDLVSFGKKR